MKCCIKSVKQILRRKNQLISIKQSCRLSIIKYINLIWRRFMVIHLIRCLKMMFIDRNIPGRWVNAKNIIPYISHTWNSNFQNEYSALQNSFILDLHTKLRIICRSVPHWAADSPGWTTCLLYDGSLLGFCFKWQLMYNFCTVERECLLIYCVDLCFMHIS